MEAQTLASVPVLPALEIGDVEIRPKEALEGESQDMLLQVALDTNVLKDEPLATSPVEDPKASSSSSHMSEEHLGIFYMVEDGEANDILAALRGSLKVIRQTGSIVMQFPGSKTQTAQISALLRAHERAFGEWIQGGASVTPETRLLIRSTPLFKPLAVYLSHIQDLQADVSLIISNKPMPHSTPSRMLRRLSTATFSSRAKSLPTPDRRESLPRRDTDVSQKETGNSHVAAALGLLQLAYEKLEHCIDTFKKERKLSEDLYGQLQRMRTALSIPHELCLEGTRQEIKRDIQAWANGSGISLELSSRTSPPSKGSKDDHEQSPVVASPETSILLLVAPRGFGKSSLAATMVCEAKQAGTLGAYLFYTPPSHDGNSLDQPRSDVTKKSPRRFSISAKMRKRSMSDVLGGVASATKKLAAKSTGRTRQNLDFERFVQDLTSLRSDRRIQEDGQKLLVIVDGLDQASETEQKRAVDVVRRAIDDNPLALRVVITSRSSDLPTSFDSLQAGGSTSQIMLDNSREGPYQGHVDVEKYVAFRLSTVVVPSDQKRIADVVNGSFSDAVRICDEVEREQMTERLLDVMLYQEIVRKQRREDGRVVVV